MRSIIPLVILLAAGLIEAPMVRAEPTTDSASRSSAHLKRTATELVQQVLLVMDTLENRGDNEQRAAAAAKKDTDGSQPMQQGVLPYALKAYKLVKGDFPVSTPREAPTEARDLFLQVKPKSWGGFVRCKLQF